MIRQTRWTALCGCISIFEWNDALPESDRVHTIIDFEARCEQHAGLAVGSGALETIRDDTAHMGEDPSA